MTTTHPRTSVDKAYAALETARNRLYVAIGERQSSKALGKLLLDIAEAEGRHETLARMWALVEKQDVTPAAAVASVMADVMVAGADDTWSGRGGDVARARFDGVRAAINDCRWL